MSGLSMGSIVFSASPGPDGFRVPNANHFSALHVPKGPWFHPVGGTPFWCYVIIDDELQRFLSISSLYLMSLHIGRQSIERTSSCCVDCGFVRSADAVLDPEYGNNLVKLSLLEHRHAGAVSDDT
jgi:hypothetical protein